MRKLVALLFFILAAVGSAQESYTLASESTLSIDGSSTIHDWTVTANKMSGTLSALENTPKAITFEVSVADIISERGVTMDNKMHDALKKEEHPKVLFALNELKGTSVLLGTLSIAGVEKQVEVETTIIPSDKGVRFKGEQKIILQDYGMEPPTAMFGQIIVGDVVTVKFDLLFEKS